MANSSTPDQRADRVQQRRYGLIALPQGLGCGLTIDQVRHRLETGRWVLVTRGLYRSASVAVTWQQRVLAACLVGPPGTAASHLTAAALYGWCDPPPLPHVTIPPGRSPRLPLAEQHRSPLSPRDVSRRARIPVTCTPRTLVDAAAVVDDNMLADLVDSALCQGRVTLGTVGAAIDRAQRKPGRAGIATLRTALEVWTLGIEPDSAAEARLLRQLREWGYPPPVTQYEIRGPDGRVVARLDLAWPAALAGLDYDSDRWHNPRRWTYDEGRHAYVEALGWKLRHVDKHDLRAGHRRLRDWLDRFVPLERDHSPAA